MARVDVNTIQAEIETCYQQVRKLQAETIHTITIKPTGEVEVVDKKRLVGLNTEIDQHKALAEANTAVLEKLIGLLGPDIPSVQTLEDRKKRLMEQIEKTENLFRIDIGNLIKYTYGRCRQRSLSPLCQFF
jgi:hypothetical protein